MTRKAPYNAALPAIYCEDRVARGLPMFSTHPPCTANRWLLNLTLEQGRQLLVDAEARWQQGVAALEGELGCSGRSVWASSKLAAKRLRQAGFTA